MGCIQSSQKEQTGDRAYVRDAKYKTGESGSASAYGTAGHSPVAKTVAPAGALNGKQAGGDSAGSLCLAGADDTASWSAPDGVRQRDDSADGSPRRECGDHGEASTSVGPPPKFFGRSGPHRGHSSGPHLSGKRRPAATLVVGDIEIEAAGWSDSDPPAAAKAARDGGPKFQSARRALRKMSLTSPGAASSESILGKETDAVEDHYTLGRHLGMGSFATTFECTENATGEVYACKNVAKCKLSNRDLVISARREVQIMHHVGSHPGIVELKAAYENQHTLSLIMELCTGGDLFASIVALGRGGYSERKAAKLVREMLEAIRHCHSMGVVHRDLKPENFLLTEDGQLKLADFGLARFFHQGEKLREGVGSVTYAAPEVLRRSYGPECDLWSLGVILYIMLTGRAPFHGATDAETVKLVVAGKVDMSGDAWLNISDGAKDLVKKLLNLNVTERLTAQQALAHPWLHAEGDVKIQNEVVVRLRQYASHQKFHKLGLMALVRHLDKDEVEGLRHIFTEMDADKSGQISPKDFRDGLRRRGCSMPPDELAQLMRNLDVDGRGSIDYHEFLAATVPMNRLATEEKLSEAFMDLDSDGCGFITADDVASFMLKLGLDFDRKEVEAMIAPVDANQDGKVDFDEWCAVMAPRMGMGIDECKGKAPNRRKTEPAKAIAADALKARSGAD